MNLNLKKKIQKRTREQKSRGLTRVTRVGKVLKVQKAASRTLRRSLGNCLEILRKRRWKLNKNLMQRKKKLEI
jgi:hypothetical protein